MATYIKRIEKDFLLKVVYDEQIPIIYLKDRVEYILVLEKPALKDSLILKADRPINKLKARNKLDLMFDYRGQMILFNVQVQSLKDELIYCSAPEYLYKNLKRAFSRTSVPREELQVRFTFLGDRYDLSYPKVMEFDTEGINSMFNNLDTNNLTGIIKEMGEWVKGYASGHKMVIFNEVKPSTTEEHILAETGKILYLPSTAGSFPEIDPYPKKRLITRDMFKRYLESTGENPENLEEACYQFIKAKLTDGIVSDAWVPILFQEYVIGYVHIWLQREGKALFDYPVIDILYQFTKVISYSLKINGYFDQGKLQRQAFQGNIIDISASGLLFAYPRSGLSSSLLPDSDLEVQLVSQRRTVNAEAKIVRRFKDSTTDYYGCHFLKMSPEDVRFVFEFLYGRPFGDSDMEFLHGQV